MISPRDIAPGPVLEVTNKADNVPITQEMRERAFDMAQQARARFNASVGQINQHYDQLKRDRMAEAALAFNKLRDRYVELSHIQLRTEAIIAERRAVQDRMQEMRRDPPRADTSDLEDQRQAEIRALDNQLAAELADLRSKRDRGELLDDGSYV